MRSDCQAGELHMDLYTLSDTLLRNLWDFTKKKIDV